MKSHTRFGILFSCGCAKILLFSFKTAMCVLGLSSYPVFLLALSFFHVSIILIQLCLCGCNVDISVSFFPLFVHP